ncbi:MAG: motility protein A [Polyangiales bacterium]
MDIATIVGIVLGFGLIIGSILLNGSLGAFIDIPSLLIVIGGTIAATLISEKLGRVLGSIKVAKNAFKTPAGDVTKTIKSIMHLSAVARKDGVLALENEKVDDTFLAKGVRMIVDGMPQEAIRETLTAQLISMKQRHQRGQKLFKFMAATAPSMGMIGTLIGLVQMLRSLDDPSSIGPAMAVALLTTMYGAILAFVVFGPIAEKLQRYTSEETLNMTVIIEGVDSISRGQNAMMIKEKLEARLDPNSRSKDDGKEAA